MFPRFPEYQDWELVHFRELLTFSPFLLNLQRKGVDDRGGGRMFSKTRQPSASLRNT
jgi:hypothetical protein